MTRIDRMRARMLEGGFTPEDAEFTATVLGGAVEEGGPLVGPLWEIITRARPDRHGRLAALTAVAYVTGRIFGPLPDWEGLWPWFEDLIRSAAELDADGLDANGPGAAAGEE